MSERKHPERRWATGVLVVSGVISLSFNTRHAFYSTSLPWPLALGYGAGPVLLAAMQSHVVALQAARGELVGGWRKAAVFGLVIGALALSFLGIYDLLREAVPNPIPGLPFNLPAILTPIVVDLMAIAALHELLRPARLADQAAAGSETGPATGSWTMPQTWSLERSETNNAGGSQTQVPDQLAEKVSDPVETNSADQVSDQPSDQSETIEAAKTQTGPKKRSRTRKAKTKTGPLDRLAEAIAVDKQHIADHGRHISAENLAKVLRIGKPAALELVKQVRGAHMDIAK